MLEGETRKGKKWRMLSNVSLKKFFLILINLFLVVWVFFALKAFL